MYVICIEIRRDAQQKKQPRNLIDPAYANRRLRCGAYQRLDSTSIKPSRTQRTGNEEQSENQLFRRTMAPPAPKRRRLSPSPNAVATKSVSDDDRLVVSSVEESESSDEDTAQTRLPSTKLYNGQLKQQHAPFPTGAYSSSLFSLKVDELLSKAQVDYARRIMKAESTLRELKDIIERIPQHDSTSV